LVKAGFNEQPDLPDNASLSPPVAIAVGRQVAKQALLSLSLAQRLNVVDPWNEPQLLRFVRRGVERFSMMWRNHPVRQAVDD
jgi:hypothetical protein